ncbi:hypothetical protein [Catellatospora coxensis]|uniref:Uncharacterized protein n=1 Tax=Catellatospora coxensis TaxID=310354 RepID=A0A8J3KU62_9ACTN|nr:hypothetical protein [Catellatospora coxensis]GIG08678.1 hypothetical protein Cco03nite_53780 [Catellatospora coxensis]
MTAVKVTLTLFRTLVMMARMGRKRSCDQVARWAPWSAVYFVTLNGVNEAAKAAIGIGGVARGFQFGFLATAVVASVLVAAWTTREGLKKIFNH